jgi:hypothetical protein
MRERFLKHKESKTKTKKSEDASIRARHPSRAELIQKALDNRFPDQQCWIRRITKCWVRFSTRSGELFEVQYLMGTGWIQFGDVLRFDPYAAKMEEKITPGKRANVGKCWSAYGKANPDIVSPYQQSIPQWGRKIKLRSMPEKRKGDV